jgi:integrase
VGESAAAAPAGALFSGSASTVEDLPEGFRFHDLRHYFASLLIAEGLDVKVVQKSLRHSLAKTTLDTYGHMWPDKEESARAAAAWVLGERWNSRTEKRG